MEKIVIYLVCMECTLVPDWELLLIAKRRIFLTTFCASKFSKIRTHINFKIIPIFNCSRHYLILGSVQTVHTIFLKRASFQSGPDTLQYVVALAKPII